MWDTPVHGPCYFTVLRKEDAVCPSKTPGIQIPTAWQSIFSGSYSYFFSTLQGLFGIEYLKDMWLFKVVSLFSEVAASDFI